VNIVTRILFWSVTIALGFVNPLISIALVVLYYLPKIVSDLIRPCEETREEFGIKSYSDDVLEDMK